MLSRRHLLKGTVALLVVHDALAQGRVEKGIYRVRGAVRVNGEPAKEGAQVRAGDAIASGERKQIRTETAVIGIRGTAVYVEAERERSYVCTCYGEASLEPLGDPAARETVRTSHHEQPRYVMATGAPQMIMRAPVINHTDAELILLESLVGRRPAFEGAAGYRRDRY